MESRIKYEFSTTMWQHQAPGGWYFVALPKAISEEIRTHLKWQEEGWGRMKAQAAIGSVQWETAIWFDTKQGTYLLPIKADVRKKTGIVVDKAIAMCVWV